VNSPSKQKEEVSRISLVPEAASVLREHAAVRDAAACRLPIADRIVVAFVVAKGTYLDGILKRDEVESSKVKKWRKTYDLSQLAKSAAASPVGFNIAGWNSSYTRQPLPAEDMREWVQTTVDRISALAPQDVLEIGCGAGLLLLRLAPACRHYVGTDFAPSVVARLKEQLAQREDLGAKVDVFERYADNFEGWAEDSFDAVIINSVAQYFPTQSYLERVLENAIRVVKPGGHVFIGDNRNRELHKALALSVEAFQSQPEVSAGELRQKITRRIQQEQELVVSPSYFVSLAARYPKVSHVGIYLRRGARDNEMTRFRFDAILAIGNAPELVREISFRERPPAGWTLPEIRSVLTSSGAETAGFAHIGNRRVERDVKLLTQLENAPPEQTLAELSREIDRDKAQAIHPEEMVGLATDMGLEVGWSWASCYPDGGYDAAFIRQVGEGNAFPKIKWPGPAPVNFVYYTNAPGEAAIREKLASELLTHCRSKLPVELTPSSCYLVDSLPPSGGGGVDCEALLAAASGLGPTPR